MPTYEIGGQSVHRKNWWMPCIIDARTDDMTDEELAAVLKATCWADNITEAEWPAVLGVPGCSQSAKSWLKRKASGWLMALQRIAYLNPEFFEAIVVQADTMYLEQIEAEPMIHFVWDASLFVNDLPVEVGTLINWHPEPNDDED